MTETPELREIAPDHFVSCHRAGELALQGVVPSVQSLACWRDALPQHWLHIVKPSVVKGGDRRSGWHYSANVDPLSVPMSMQW